MIEASAKRPNSLVAGGAGFIGSNLCRDLLAAGHNVDCVDNISTGRVSNIKELEANPAFRFVYVDVADAEDCAKLRRRYSRIYHLACPTGVPNIAILGEEMLTASSAGTHNLLALAKRSQARFLFASSAEAYGDPEVFPQPEEYVGHVDPVGPRSPYEVGKRFGESMTRYFGKKHGIPVHIVRIFNTYGSFMSPTDQRVIPQMLSQAVSGLPIPIYGDGQQTRTFLHVDDLMRAFEVVLTKGTPGDVYNIGGGSETRIIDLFNLIKTRTALPLEAEFRPHFIHDHAGRWPDTTKLHALGWQPGITLEEGIDRSYLEFVATLSSEQRASSKTRPRPTGTRQAPERLVHREQPR